MNRLVVAFGLGVVLAGVAAGSALLVAGKSVPVTTLAGNEYVALSDLAAALGGRSWQVGSRLILIVPSGNSKTPDSSAARPREGEPGNEYLFRLDSAFVLAAGQRIALPCLPLLRDSEAYVPAAVLAQLFPAVPAPRLTGVETTTRGDTTLLLLRVTKPAGYGPLVVSGRSLSSLEYRLVTGIRFDSSLLAVPAGGTGIIRALSIEQGELVIGFRQPTYVAATGRDDGVEVRVWPRPERRLQTIVLDAGHGGKDPGAVGRAYGTQEKTIVLDIVMRLKAKLEKQGLTVLLTRDRDCDLGLAERARMANSSRADLFVSIHANSAPNRTACGFETYFLSEAKTDWERAVAARENAGIDTITGADFGSGDIGLILADLAQHEHLFESSELAARIQEAVVPHARVMDRGVRQANFYVLRNDFMPAVLVECGFLSNRSEEKLLRQPAHREKLAEGICRGILAYRDSFARRSNGNGRG